MIHPKNEVYFQTKSDVETLISTYKKEHPSYYSIKYGQVYGEENELVPTTLPLGSSRSSPLLVQYRDFGNCYLAFYTYRGKPNYLKIPITAGIKAEMERFLTSIQSKTTDIKERGYRLYEAFLDVV